MPTNIDSFLRQLEKEAEERSRQEVLALHKKIVLEALRRVVQKTPVDTGRARGNWQTEIGSEGDFLTESADRNPNDIQNDAIGVLSNLKPFQTVFISNNVDYIEFLEEGSSQQAPEGMVATTVEELRVMFE